MLSPDAVLNAAGTMLHELLGFRDTFDRLHRQPRPAPADYGNLNADQSVATAIARFDEDAVRQGRDEIEQLIDATTKVIEYALAMRDNDQTTAARVAAIARESRGGQPAAQQL